MKLVITVKQVNDNQEAIGQVRFDKDIKKEINLTDDKLVKYLSKKVDDLVLDMDEKKFIDYLWKIQVEKAREIDNT
jgi:hypothetical protein